MNIIELAAYLNYDYVGDPDVDIQAISYAKDAKENSIAIAYSKKDILQTKARVVLTVPRLLLTEKYFLYSYEELELSTIKTAKVLIEAGCLPDYSKPIVYQSLGRNYMTGKNCTFGDNTSVGPYCVLGDNVHIGNNCFIDSNVWIGSDVTIGDNVILRSGAKVGTPSFFHYRDEKLKSFVGIGSVHIDNNVEIGFNTTIHRGTFSDTRIGYNTKIGNLVEIGHDVQIGTECKIVSQSGLAGNVTIGNHVQVLGQVGIANYVTVHDDAVLIGKSSVTKDVGKGEKISGMFGREHIEELRLQAKIRKFFKSLY